MSTEEEIADYLASQPEPKRSGLEELHRFMLREFPSCTLWFSDGRNADGKVVANPSVGYGQRSIIYADGTTKDFYRIGMSANKTGISVYVLGLKDKSVLGAKFGDKLGKASVTGYCIKFKKTGDINIDTLRAAIRYGMAVADES
jgi:hypothetical protein